MKQKGIFNVVELKFIDGLKAQGLTWKEIVPLRAPRLAVRPRWLETNFFWKFGEDVINYYLSLE
jgi:hypothetical protein